MIRLRGVPEPVLVVGAGVTGLVAARALADHGLEVVVLDKARGVGGRLATRRLAAGASFDHGAAQFDPVSEPFRRQMEAWAEDGVVERAGSGAGDGTPSYRVRGPATGLAKHVARGLDVRLGARAVALARDGESFRLAFEDGPELRGEAAILTPPVPQSLDLLARGGLAACLPSGLLAALGAVAYHPTFVLLLRLDRRVDGFPSPGPLVLRDGGPVSRVLENAREDGPSRLSVYARESWAAQRYEAPEEEIAAELEGAASSATGFERASVVERELKRWRYARPSVPFPGDVPLVDVEGLPLLLAGDAFGSAGQAPTLSGNTGLERAFLSGVAAANRLLGLRAGTPGPR